MCDLKLSIWFKRLSLPLSSTFLFCFLFRINTVKMICLPLHIFYLISTIVPGCHISFSVYPTQRYLKFSLCYCHSCLLCCMLNFEIIYYKNDEYHQSSPCWQVSFSHRKNLTYFITFNYHSSLRIINYNIK